MLLLTVLYKIILKIKMDCWTNSLNLIAICIHLRFGVGDICKLNGALLRLVAQLYGQERTDWNQCFVIDCSLSHPAGHKPFTCYDVHTAFYVPRDSVRRSLNAFFFSPFCACIYDLAEPYWSSFSSVVPWASCRMTGPLTVFCVMFADRCCRYASSKQVQDLRQ